jgi:hypothetical protein
MSQAGLERSLERESHCFAMLLVGYLLPQARVTKSESLRGFQLLSLMNKLLDIWLQSHGSSSLGYSRAQHGIHSPSSFTSPFQPRVAHFVSFLPKIICRVPQSTVNKNRLFVCPCFPQSPVVCGHCFRGTGQIPFQNPARSIHAVQASFRSASLELFQKPRNEHSKPPDSFLWGLKSRNRSPALKLPEDSADDS